MNVLLWAGRYGAQVRQLEDHGLDDDRMRVRLAWMMFLRQFAEPQAKLVSDAYWTEYAKY